MAKSVRIRFKRALPGVGFDANGNPKNGKTEVQGKLVVTSFNGGGESLTPADLTLGTIDGIHLSVDEGMGSKSGQPRTARYSFAAQEFYVLQDDSTSGTSAKDYNVSFVAFGDSLLDNELL